LEKENHIIYFGDSVPTVNKTVAVVHDDAEFTDFVRIVLVAEGLKLLIYRKEIVLWQQRMYCRGVKKIW
jgi:hypothetical protein